jgi:GR25 family glycosyltransferase involved in LPS biosynthesis
MKYYLITYNQERYEFMLQQFSNYNINTENLDVINYPNREDLTQELINFCYDINRFKELNNRFYVNSYAWDWHNPMPSGIISCSYKHYTCIKNIFESELAYGVIMEDNILIKQNVPETIDKYLLEVGNDWDIIFDGNICNFHSENIVSGKLVYEAEYTRGLNFYIISSRGAKKLIDLLIPFSLNLDNFINLLIDENLVDLKIFWAESGLIEKRELPSTWR